jgi:hypothetical protein
MPRLRINPNLTHPQPSRTRYDDIALVAYESGYHVSLL